MQNIMFPLLVVGLDKYLRQATPYPYPAELQHAMNILATKMKPAFPATFKEFLVRLEEPVEVWYPENDVPDGLDKRFGILSSGSLHEIAEEYLIDADLRGIVDVESLLSHQEDAMMADFRRKVHTAYKDKEDDNEALEIEKGYATARRFLILHGFSTAREVRNYIHGVEIYERIYEMFMPVEGDMYEQFVYPNEAGKPVCWNCSECGPLYIREGRRVSIKPADCKSKCPGINGWQQIPYSGDLKVLRRGLHRRTLIPGIAEIRLFEWLQKQQRSHPELIAEVRLYPGADEYDIRVVFTEIAGHEKLAIDVKDYQSPVALASQLTKRSFYQGNDPLLSYDRACYVVPDYRIEDNPRYLDEVRRLAPHVELYSVKEFQALIEDKLWRAL